MTRVKIKTVWLKSTFGPFDPLEVFRRFVEERQVHIFLFASLYTNPLRKGIFCTGKEFSLFGRKLFLIEQTLFITETCLYKFDPLKPHCCIVKPGVYRGMHHFSYFCSKHRLWVFVRTASTNIDCEYSLEPPRRGGSNEHPQPMF